MDGLLQGDRNAESAFLESFKDYFIMFKNNLELVYSAKRG